MVARSVLLLGLVVASMWTSPLWAQSPADKAKLLDTLWKLELDSWELLKKQDVAASKAFFPEDAVLIFSDGSRYNKEEFLKFTAEYKLESYKAEDKPELLMLSPDVAIVIYEITYTGTEKGEDKETSTVVASSTYVRRNGKWVDVFYQETEEDDDDDDDDDEEDDK
jgi:uncharacterized protein (TIGR02246 family)